MTPGGEKPKYLLPVLIIGLGLLLRLWGLASSDLQGDAAINSFRAMGWFDYFLTDEGQTSPVSWFGYFPWWSYLSFHDHPPLVFALQYVSFFLFGSETIVALYPHLLAFIATSLLLFEGLQRLRNRRMALLALLVFSISSYSIWATRTGYLEGVALLFVTASFFALCFFMERQKPRYLYAWAAAGALGLLSKYTTIFAPAAGMLSLALWHRPTFKSKHWWLSLLLMLTLLTPIIIYNAMVFATRGHFDASLSSMIGMQPDDFSYIASRTSGITIANIISPWTILFGALSLPFFLITMAALALLAKRLITRTADTITKVVLMALLISVALFSIAGASERFVTILVPFLAIAVGLALDDAFTSLSEQRNRKQLIATLFIGILAFELFYAVNTNILVQPVGRSPWLYSAQRFYQRGFQDLDNFLRANVLPELPRRIDRSRYGTPDFKSSPTVIVDDRADWFSLMWYFRRYLYYGIPVITITDLYRISAESETNAIELLNTKGARQFWFVYMLPEGVRRNAEESYTSKVELFHKQLQDAGVKPRNFTDYKGTPVFELYQFEYQ